MHRHRQAAGQIRSSLPVPDKLFYKIGEVSKITGVESYVLRYWETEFPFLKPRKNKSGQRVYVKKDLELILQIKKMLYQERFTIEGVRKKLGQGVHVAPVEQAQAVEQPPKESPQTPSQVLDLVRNRLRTILKTLQ